MMLLSRFWYVILSVFMGLGLYVSFLAVGQVNRRMGEAQMEALASDSQTVGWSLQIDARRRLDAMLLWSVDPGVREALKLANGKEKVPTKARDDARKATLAVLEKISADFRPDAVFAVDRDGRVVAQTGFDQVRDEFELGGFAAVFDALHGFMRDDTWVLGPRVYRVVARPVEDDVTQPPLGAVVGLRAVDARFAQELAKRTRTNLAFYANGQKVAAATGMEGTSHGPEEDFDARDFELIVSELPKLPEDNNYKTRGRTDDVRSLSPRVGAIFTRLTGEAWDLQSGFAVLRARPEIASPLEFITKANTKDRQNARLAIIIAAVLVAAFLGLLLSYLEYSRPLREMVVQGDRLKRGEIDGLQVARFRGPYRQIAADLNAGMERVLEKTGGGSRKPADLESILGPAPAQPAMSAFTFPTGDFGASKDAPPSRPRPPGSSPTLSGPANPPNAPPAATSAAPPPTPARKPPPPPAKPSSPSQSNPQPAPPAAIPASEPSARSPGFEDESTMVGKPPSEVLAAASQSVAAIPVQSAATSPEWPAVYEEFVRMKRECGESVDGLTFEKFQQTLRKNQDALIQRHGVKRVKFSVYVKDGKASLKATPVRD